MSGVSGSVVSNGGGVVLAEVLPTILDMEEELWRTRHLQATYPSTCTSCSGRPSHRNNTPASSRTSQTCCFCILAALFRNSTVTFIHKYFSNMDFREKRSCIQLTTDRKQHTPTTSFRLVSGAASVLDSMNARQQQSDIQASAYSSQPSFVQSHHPEVTRDGRQHEETNTASREDMELLHLAILCAQFPALTVTSPPEHQHSPHPAITHRHTASSAINGTPQLHPWQQHIQRLDEELSCVQPDVLLEVLRL